MTANVACQRVTGPGSGYPFLHPSARAMIVVCGAFGNMMVQDQRERPPQLPPIRRGVGLEGSSNHGSAAPIDGRSRSEGPR